MIFLYVMAALIVGFLLFVFLIGLADSLLFVTNRQSMRWFAKWFLKRLCQKLVVQGTSHQYNIIEYYRIMNLKAKDEFLEDSKPTLDYFLADCHEKSLRRN